MNKLKAVSDFPGVWARSLQMHEDNRGYFFEELRKSDLPESTPEFVQDSISFSKMGVLRGMHLQLKQWQLLTLLEGEIFDVLLNLDEDSPNFMSSIPLNLAWNRLNQLLIAPGIAHGFAVLSDEARIHYKSSVYYGSTDQFGVHWNSEEIRDMWPKVPWTISERDSTFPSLQEFNANNA